MNQHLEHIVRQALKNAEAQGKDYITQTALAVGTVLGTHPYMTAADALAMVETVRHSPQSEQSRQAARFSYLRT